MTEHGRLIALPVPPEPADIERERLVAAGILLPGNGLRRLPDLRPANQATADVLDELRHDR